MLTNIIGRTAIGTIIILVLPLVLTFLNPNSHLNGGNGGGWDWSPGDFLLMGALIFCTGLAINFAWIKINDPLNRILGSLAIIFIFLAIWVELAVGGVSQILYFIFS